jgi:hypothetical protein
MDTVVQDPLSTTMKSGDSMAIHTTLYDLVAALTAEAGPEEEDAVTAAMMHILNTHLVTCTGDLEGYRMLCDATRHPANVERFEKPDHQLEKVANGRERSHRRAVPEPILYTV